MSGGDADLGEAVDFILAQRPDMAEDEVWSVLVELQAPPPGGDELALELLARTRPDVARRDAKAILREWRAYVSLVAEDDWDDE